MILGFAHLTRSTGHPDVVIAGFERQGMTVTARRKDVPSAPEKWPLLDRRAHSHELALLTGSPPVEVVSHDTGAVDAPSRLDRDMAKSEIRVRVRDTAVVTRFFVDGLGFRAADGTLRLDGRFPQWSATVRLDPKADAPLDPPLDVEGWSCLAFYVTNPEADSAHLCAQGGRDCTAPFQVQWQAGRMGITMLRDPEGTIIELIKILDRK